MSALLAAFLLGSQPAAPLPEHVLRFHYYRLVVFQHQARQWHCAAGDLDRALEKIRARLNKRYGKDAFKPWEPEPGGTSDCGVILGSYRRNLEEFRIHAETALNAPRSAPGS